MSTYTVFTKIKTPVGNYLQVQEDLNKEGVEEVQRSITDMLSKAGKGFNSVWKLEDCNHEGTTVTLYLTSQRVLESDFSIRVEQHINQKA